MPIPEESGVDEFGAAEGRPSDLSVGGPGVGLGEAIRVRRLFGLNDDPGFVRDLVESGRTVEGPPGLVMSEQERPEVEARLAVPLARVEALEVAQATGSFAGTYIDDRGVQVIALTESPPNVRAEISDAFERGLAAVEMSDAARDALAERSRVEVITADRTLAELAELKKAVRSRFGPGSPDGDQSFTVVQVGIDEEANAVTVGVIGNLGQVTATLRQLYGAAIGDVYEAEDDIQLDACNSRENCQPLRAGMKIWTPKGGACTSGFVARQPSGNQVLTTASHCAFKYGNFVSGQFRHPSSTNIGSTAAYSFWYSQQNAFIEQFSDGLAINTADWKTAPTLYVNPGIRDVAVVGKQRANGDSVGDYVYMSGAYSGDVGPNRVDKRFEDRYSNNCECFIEHLRESSYTSTNGDSGGPVYGVWFPAQNRYAVGLHQGRSNGKSYYSHITNVEREVGVDVQVASQDHQLLVNRELFGGFFSGPLFYAGPWQKNSLGQGINFYIPGGQSNTNFTRDLEFYCYNGPGCSVSQSIPRRVSRNTNVFVEAYVRCWSINPCSGRLALWGIGGSTGAFPYYTSFNVSPYQTKRVSFSANITTRHSSLKFELYNDSPARTAMRLVYPSVERR